MSIELVTGHAGRNHVDSEDVGAFYAGVVGKGRYALDVGENLAVTMSDANTVRIGTGLFVMDGRYVRVKDAESVKVANGAQAAYRKDLVVCTYTRDPSNGNVEGVAVSVLQGKAAPKESDANVPTFEKGDILNGDLKATVALAEVDLAGLTPTARLLLPSVTSLRKLGDSVSQINQYPGGMSGNVKDQSWYVLPLGGNRVALVFKASPWYTELSQKEYNYKVTLPIKVKKVLFSCSESEQWRCDRTRATFIDGDTTVMNLVVNIDRDAYNGTVEDPFYMNLKAMVIAEI